MPQLKGKFSGTNGANMKIMLYRYAVLMSMLDFKPTVDEVILKPTQQIKDKVTSDSFMYSEQKERLLFLYAAGAISDDCLSKLIDTETDILDMLIELETRLVKQEKEAFDKEKISIAAEIYHSLKQHSIFPAISFSLAYKIATLCISSNEYISFNEILSYDKKLTEWLAEIGEPLAVYSGNKFTENTEPNETAPMYLIDVCKLPFILNYINHLYGRDFIKSVIENKNFDKELTDDDWKKKHNEYLTNIKLHFEISAYTRKRNICGDKCNILDYRNNIVEDGKLVDSAMKSEEEYCKTIQLRVSDVSSDIENPTTDEEILKKVFAKYKEGIFGNPELAIIVRNNKKEYMFNYKDGKFIKIDKNDFETIPFDYDRVWTYIQQASRSNNIVRTKDTILFTLNVNDEYKLTEKELEYAKRMVIEQVNEQRKASPIISKLSQLIKSAKETQSENASKSAVPKGQSGGKSSAPQHKQSDIID